MIPHRTLSTTSVSSLTRYHRYGFLAKCCSVVPTGSADVSLAVAIFSRCQHLYKCTDVGSHARAGTPRSCACTEDSQGQVGADGWRGVSGD